MCQKGDVESGSGQIEKNSRNSATRPNACKLLELLAVAKNHKMYHSL